MHCYIFALIFIAFSANLKLNFRNKKFMNKYTHIHALHKTTLSSNLLEVVNEACKFNAKYRLFNFLICTLTFQQKVERIF